MGKTLRIATNYFRNNIIQIRSCRMNKRRRAKNRNRSKLLTLNCKKFKIKQAKASDPQYLIRLMVKMWMVFLKFKISKLSSRILDVRISMFN